MRNSKDFTYAGCRYISITERQFDDALRDATLVGQGEEGSTYRTSAGKLVAKIHDGNSAFGYWLIIEPTVSGSAVRS